MDQAETQQRQGETRGVEASRVCEEFNAASSVEHSNTDQLSMIFGGEKAAVEQRADMLHQSSVILNAAQLARALNIRKQRRTGDTIYAARADQTRRHS